MTIRQSRPEDLPQIIALLRQSIGEVLTPKTETYFLWKHSKNPFGQSKILLAEEDQKIIGLRTFMHWNWVSDHGTVTAVRAVDTATDPAHQGKGIFKKLTLQVVEECTKEGVGIVFNSPNPVSKQGYLKMGWVVAGRLPLFLGVGSLRPRLHEVDFAERIYTKFSVAVALQQLSPDWQLEKTSAKLHTPINYAFLRWRYQECPVAKYGAVIEAGGFGFIFRIKKVNRFFELRICEAWTEHDEAHGHAVRAFKNLVRELRPAMVSSGEAPLYHSGSKKIARLFGPIAKGPVITIRPLHLTNTSEFNSFTNWAPSLGSMELF